MDVTNSTVMDDVWDLISNKLAIWINQAWHGHPGGQYLYSPKNVTVGYDNEKKNFVEVPEHQYLYKLLCGHGKRAAVLVMNSKNETISLDINFSDIPGLTASKLRVTNVWTGEEMGTY